jgi:hypothetical protein
MNGASDENLAGLATLSMLHVTSTPEIGFIRRIQVSVGFSR